MKECSICLLEQELTEFSPQNTKSGYSTQCKNCSYVRSRLWFEGITPVPNEVLRLIVRSQLA